MQPGPPEFALRHHQGVAAVGFVVVGLDGSQTSRGAFREAVREAQWRDARVVVVHVLSYPVTAMQEFAMTVPVEAIRSSAERLIASQLEKLEAEYEGGFPVEVERRIASGHPGVEIIRAAEGTDGEPAELVVLGSRGLGGFKGLLLGSVTTYAAHHLPCRLLIVPAIAD